MRPSSRDNARLATQTERYYALAKTLPRGRFPLPLDDFGGTWKRARGEFPGGARKRCSGLSLSPPDSLTGKATRQCDSHLELRTG